MKKISTLALCLLAAACAPQVSAGEPSPAVNHAVAPLPSTPNPSRTNVGIQELAPVANAEQDIVTSAPLKSNDVADVPRSLKLDDVEDSNAQTSKKSTSDSFEYYTVSPGDTVYSLARRYKTTPKQIIELNTIPAPYGLNVGQKIKIGKEQHESRQIQADRYALSAPPLKTPELQTPSSASYYRKAALMWPVQGRVIASYGDMGKGQRNDGINIAVAKGTPVRAADNGIVAYAGNKIKGFGNLVLLRHSGGFVTAYAHNDRIAVKSGTYIKRGEVIAFAGQTGSVDVPQVHFQVRRGKKPVDPLAYLERTPVVPSGKPELLASRKVDIFGEYN